MIRVAINGFGRIGRNIPRPKFDIGRDDFEIVAVNDLGPLETYAHLRRFDSVHGLFPHEVTASGDTITAGSRSFKVTAVKNPANLPHEAMNVDIVLECTGILQTKVIDGNFVNILGWCNNRLGFSNRMVDVTAAAARTVS